jgi:hypothetical protein
MYQRHQYEEKRKSENENGGGGGEKINGEISIGNEIMKMAKIMA